MNTDIYKTKDLGEAAALIMESKQLVTIQREGKICWFLFQDKESCEAISNNFFFGQLLVNARDYFEALARLKNRIFSY